MKNTQTTYPSTDITDDQVIYTPESTLPIVASISEVKYIRILNTDDESALLTIEQLKKFLKEI